MPHRPGFSTTSYARQHLYGPAVVTPEELERIPEFAGGTEQADGAPQFRDGGMPDDNGLGNRRRLYVRHALLLTHAPQIQARRRPACGSLAQIREPCRDIPGCGPALSVTLPTASGISGQPKWTDSGDRRRFLPGRNVGSMTIDGTRMPYKRPGNPEGQRGTYSGRIRQKFADAEGMRGLHADAAFHDVAHAGPERARHDA